MPVLKIEMDGVTTSFRHPHFLMGRQPSYPLPPPATIFGHIASALGEYPNPELIRFAYSFQSSGRVDDMENIYLATVRGSVPRQAKATWPHPVNLTAEMNPILRELLFHPHMTLYLDAPEMLDTLYQAFRSPRYMVILGRSQDLVSYRSVDIIETEEAAEGYLEGTLISHSHRDLIRNVVTMMMPRYIDPNDRRKVLWSPYLVLERREGVVARPGEQFVIDPESQPTKAGLHRVLYWHSFTADQELTIEVGGVTH